MATSEACMLVIAGCMSMDGAIPATPFVLLSSVLLLLYLCVCQLCPGLGQLVMQPCTLILECQNLLLE